MVFESCVMKRKKEEEERRKRRKKKKKKKKEEEEERRKTKSKVSSFFFSTSEWGSRTLGAFVTIVLARFAVVFSELFPYRQPFNAIYFQNPS